MNGTRHLLLGLFFLSSFGILAAYTLFLYDLPWLGSHTVWRIEFPEANGLRVGDAVRASGMQIGRVTRMSFDPEAAPERRISVTVSLETPVVLHEGYRILIEETTLLGGRDIDIDTGPPEAPRFEVGPDVVLRGSLERPPLEALAAIGELVRENGASVTEMLDNANAIVRDVREGKGSLGRLVADQELSQRLSTGVDRFALLMEDASALSADVRAGRGTLGKLFTEEELYVSVRQVTADLEGGVADLKVLAADLREGRGTVGRLLRDDGLADEVQAAIEDLREILRRVRDGEGTVGRLVNDPAIAERIESIAAKIDSGEGVVGGLLADDQLYGSLKSALDDLAAVSAKLRSGEGTLGRLVQEEEVYKELLAAVRLLTRSLEDYREAAPVSTFTNVLFGAF